MNVRPPNRARGTVKIIMKGCRNELNVAAITKYAVNKANANIINNSLLVSFNSSDLPFHSIRASGTFSFTVFSSYFRASERV